MKSYLNSNSVKLGILTAIIAVAMPELSFAEGTIGDMMKTVSDEQLVEAPKLISVAAYCIGGIMLLSGGLSLKKHAENPASEPLGKGLGRLLVGAGITSLPAILALVRTSTGFAESSESGYSALKITP
ncbi:MAG: hypothetical protein AB7S81_01880 [Bdellovibrionales bacterium]